MYIENEYHKESKEEHQMTLKQCRMPFQNRQICSFCHNTQTVNCEVIPDYGIRTQYRIQPAANALPLRLNAHAELLYRLLPRYLGAKSLVSFS